MRPVDDHRLDGGHAYNAVPGAHLASPMEVRTATCPNRALIFYSTGNVYIAKDYSFDAYTDALTQCEVCG